MTYSIDGQINVTVNRWRSYITSVCALWIALKFYFSEPSLSVHQNGCGIIIHLSASYIAYLWKRRKQIQDKLFAIPEIANPDELLRGIRDCGE